MYRKASAAIKSVIRSRLEDGGESNITGTGNNNAGTPVAVELVLRYTIAD